MNLTYYFFFFSNFVGSYKIIKTLGVKTYIIASLFFKSFIQYFGAIIYAVYNIKNQCFHQEQ